MLDPENWDDLIAIDKDDEHDDALKVLLRVLDAQKCVNRIVAMAKKQACAWCEKNGALKVSDERWFSAGVEKKAVVPSPTKVIDKLLEVAGGDLEMICTVLSANSIKHGSLRKMLIAELGKDEGYKVFDSLVVYEERPKMVDGKPTKSLIEKDKRFVR